MPNRNEPAIKKTPLGRLVPSLQRALVAFYQYTEENGCSPSQKALGDALKKSKEYGRQCINSLILSGHLERLDKAKVRYAPWKLSLAGRRAAMKLAKSSKKATR